VGEREGEGGEKSHQLAFVFLVASLKPGVFFLCIKYSAFPLLYEKSLKPGGTGQVGVSGPPRVRREPSLLLYREPCVGSSSLFCGGHVKKTLPRVPPRLRFLELRCLTSHIGSGAPLDPADGPGGLEPGDL